MVSRSLRGYLQKSGAFFFSPRLAQVVLDPEMPSESGYAGLGILSLVACLRCSGSQRSNCENVSNGPRREENLAFL